MFCQECGFIDTRISNDYRNGERCAANGCKFKDVVFHHTDYRKERGNYLCGFHHMMEHFGEARPPHLDRVLASAFFEMLISRFILLPAASQNKRTVSAVKAELRFDSSRINPHLKPSLNVIMTLKVSKS